MSREEEEREESHRKEDQIRRSAFEGHSLGQCHKLFETVGTACNIVEEI